MGDRAGEIAPCPDKIRTYRKIPVMSPEFVLVRIIMNVVALCAVGFYFLSTDCTNYHELFFMVYPQITQIMGCASIVGWAVPTEQTECL